MNFLAGCATGVIAAVPAMYWAMLPAPDPELEASWCYKQVMQQLPMEDFPVPKTRDAGSVVLSRSPPAKALTGQCRTHLINWAKRDGDKLVNQKLAHVALVTFVESTDDPIKKMFVMQKVKEIEAATERCEWM